MGVNANLPVADNIEEPFENYFKRVRKNYGRTKIVISSTPGQQVHRAGELIGDQLALLTAASEIRRREGDGFQTDDI